MIPQQRLVLFPVVRLHGRHFIIMPFPNIKVTLGMHEMRKLLKLRSTFVFRYPTGQA